MAENPVTFESDGQQVVGMLHLPEDPSASVPGVIFCHGFTGHKHESHRLFVQTARALAEQGIASLRFDFRGSGDSEGAFVDCTLAGQVADARRALEYLREQACVDPARSGVVGMSMGGLVAAHIMSEHPEIPAAVLWCPVAHTVNVIRKKANVGAPGQLALKGRFDLNGWAVGRAFIQELAASKPLKIIGQTRAQTLLIHGDQDESVSVEDAYAYEKVIRAAGGVVETRILKGAGHTFDSLEWVDEVVQRTTEWLRARL